MSLPPLPPGAVLDEDEALPPLPPGAKLDGHAVDGPSIPAPEAAEPEAFTPQSKSGAVLQGAATGTSLGFKDEMAGAVAAGADKLARNGVLKPLATRPGRWLLRKLLPEMKELPDSALDAAAQQSVSDAEGLVTGFKQDDKRSIYQQVRDAARTEDAKTKEANPTTYGTAEFAGAMLAPVPKVPVSGLLAKGQKLTPLAERALAGASMGAASGLGGSEQEGAGALKDAIAGAGMGMVAAPVIGGVADFAGGKLSRWLENLSRKNALRAVGNTAGMTDKLRKLGYKTPEEQLALGAKLRDDPDNLIPVLSTSEGAAGRIGAALDDSVSAKSGAVDELEAMAQQQGKQFDFDAIAKRAEGDLKPESGWDPISRRHSAKALGALGEASAAQGGFPMAEQVRRGLGKDINWKGVPMGSVLPEEVAQQRKAYFSVADEIRRQAAETETKHLLAQGKRALPEDLGATQQLESMNSRISTLMDAAELANADASRQSAKHGGAVRQALAAAGLGLGIGAGHGAQTGGLAAAGGALAAHLYNVRGPSLMTHVQHGVAQALPKVAPGLATGATKAAMSPDEEKSIQAFLEGG